MAISLYDASVVSYLQTLGAVSGFPDILRSESVPLGKRGYIGALRLKA